MQVRWKWWGWLWWLRRIWWDDEYGDELNNNGASRAIQDDEGGAVTKQTCLAPRSQLCTACATTYRLKISHEVVSQVLEQREHLNNQVYLLNLNVKFYEQYLLQKKFIIPSSTTTNYAVRWCLVTPREHFFLPALLRAQTQISSSS